MKRWKPFVHMYNEKIVPMAVGSESVSTVLHAARTGGVAGVPIITTLILATLRWLVLGVLLLSHVWKLVVSFEIPLRPCRQRPFHSNFLQIQEP